MDQNGELFTRFFLPQSLSDDQIHQKRMVENLMEIRFKVVQDYPWSEFKMDQVIAPKSNHKIDHYRSFPRIFKELKWYQDLPEESTPSYLISRKLGIVARVVPESIKRSVNSHKTIVTLEDYTGSQCVMFLDDLDLVPATIYQWNQYVQKKTAAKG